MAHPNGEDPVTVRGTNSEASKQEKKQHDQNRYRRARHRFQVAKHYVDNLSHLSYREAVPELEELIESGEFPRQKVPSHATLWRWVQTIREVQEEGEAPSCFDFMEGKRTGRNRTELTSELREWLDRQIVQGKASSVRDLFEKAEEAAPDHEWEPPSMWQVRRHVEEFSAHDESAARHGRNAAVVDATPASTLPTQRPHEMWLMDETKSPVFIRTLDPSTREWVAVKPWIILVLDVHSRLILTYHIVDPFRHGADTSYTTRDIFGTFLGAALPELAPSETKPYAGYLPDQLRWDKHSTHEKLRSRLEEHGIDVPQAVGEKPHRQGRIERTIGTVKELSRDILGFGEAYHPVGDGTTDEHPKSKRRKAAGDEKRVRKKTPIHVEDLHRIGEFREDFGQKVADYNSSTHAFLDGMSPEIAYLRRLEKETTRSGRDAVFMMDDNYLTCTKAGLVHQEDGNRVRFAAESAGVELDVGDSVHCFFDPLQRRLFAEYGGRLLSLKPIEEYAEDESGEAVARRKQRRAAEASGYAEQVQKAELEKDAGPTAPERAQAAMAEETGEDEEDDLPPRHQGLVAHKRAEALQEMRRQSEEEAVEDVAPDMESLGNPRDEIRLKEEAS